MAPVVETLRFTVADSESGSRLDQTLAARSEIGTRSLAERLLAAGAVIVDGESRPKSHRLESGSVVEVRLPEGPRPVEAGPVTVGIAYEDAHVLVLDKPAGVAVHPGAGTKAETLLPQLLTLGATGGDDPERPGVVHRLDRDTSGLLVVARSEEAYRGAPGRDAPPSRRAQVPRTRSRPSSLADGTHRRTHRTRPP